MARTRSFYFFSSVVLSKTLGPFFLSLNFFDASDFEFLDGTSNDFISVGNQFPWADEEPNNFDGEQECVGSAYTFDDPNRLEDFSCSGEGFDVNLIAAACKQSITDSPTQNPTVSPTDNPTGSPVIISTATPNTNPDNSPSSSPVQSLSPTIQEEVTQDHWAQYKEEVTGTKSDSPLGFDWARMRMQREFVKTPQTSHGTPMTSTGEMLSLKKSLNQLKGEARKKGLFSAMGLDFSILEDPRVVPFL